MSFLIRKRVRYPDDCIRIRNVMESHGWSCSLHDVEKLWDYVSEKHGAGWLVVDSDDTVFDLIIDHVQEEE